jgi:hypothetical protein
LFDFKVFEFSEDFRQVRMDRCSNLRRPVSAARNLICFIPVEKFVSDAPGA